ncbi:LysM peptidoglycan-binding domain-containing protein [Micrococcoides hystricis]|uniref:LysM peptidoglycan-binding domain-containing protein n=1 Tax=Micrococcoides hystricis TaxID=1572761 RepID=A0ABV6P8J9_9MICC
MATATTALTLTRRGRFLFRGMPLLAAIIAALIVMMYLFAAQTNQAQAVGSVEGVPTKQVTVYAGDTLWDIASAERPDQDVAVTMMQIEELNGLDKNPLQPGQSIEVPTP